MTSLKPIGLLEDSHKYTLEFRQELDAIAQSAKKSCSWSRMRIQGYNESHADASTLTSTGGKVQFVAKCVFHFLQLIFRIFLCFFKKYAEQNRDTIKYLNARFGQARVNRISQAYDLHIEKKRSHGAELSKGCLQKLLAGLSVVTKTDIRELFNSIIEAKNNNSVNYLKAEHVQELKNKFGNRTFEELKEEDIDLLYDLAKPIDSKTLFFHKIPKYKYTGYDRGKTAKGLLPIAYELQKLKELRKKHLQKPESTEDPSDPNSLQFKANYKMLKRVVGFYNPHEMLIPQPNGWHAVNKDKRISGKGLYAVVLEPLGADSKLKLTFVYLCTQALGLVPWRWESLVEDINRCVGQEGVKTTIDYVGKLIGNREVVILGYSLGGAQAQRTAATLAAQGKKITYVLSLASPGLERPFIEKCHDLFKQDLIKHIPTMHHVRDFGDLVTLAGDGNICFDPKKTRLTILHRRNEKPFSVPPAAYGAGTIVHLGFKALMSTHARDTLSLKDCVISSVNGEDSPEVVQTVLDHGKIKEAIGWGNLLRSLGGLFSKDTDYTEWQDKRLAGQISA